MRARFEVPWGWSSAVQTPGARQPRSPSGSGRSPGTAGPRYLPGA